MLVEYLTQKSSGEIDSSLGVAPHSETYEPELVLTLSYGDFN